jgi:hypothetical protein
MRHPTSLTIRTVELLGSPSEAHCDKLLNLLLVALLPVNDTRLATNIVQVAVVVPFPLYHISWFGK